MINQDRANPPASGAAPADGRDQGEPCDSRLDSECHSSFDYIDEAIEESMDASDPPAFTPQTGVGAPHHAAEGQPARRD